MSMKGVPDATIAAFRVPDGMTADTSHVHVQGHVLADVAIAIIGVLFAIVAVENVIVYVIYKNNNN
jgi:hypothetical protein